MVARGTLKAKCVMATKMMGRHEQWSQRLLLRVWEEGNAVLRIKCPTMPNWRQWPREQLQPGAVGRQRQANRKQLQGACCIGPGNTRQETTNSTAYEEATTRHEGGTSVPAWC